MLIIMRSLAVWLVGDLPSRSQVAIDSPNLDPLNANTAPGVHPAADSHPLSFAQDGVIAFNARITIGLDCQAAKADFPGAIHVGEYTFNDNAINTISETRSRIGNLLIDCKPLSIPTPFDQGFTMLAVSFGVAAQRNSIDPTIGQDARH